MIEAELPQNEAGRMYALNGYQILDTMAEQGLDDLVQLASRICEAPVSIISLIDENRSWFKSSYGVPRGEVERKYSICSHAILQKDIFVIEDTLLDERFHDNPAVRGDLSIRFYAGAPLTTCDGFNLGTLCVLDSKPRQLSEHQYQALSVLATQVVQQFELRKSNLEILRKNKELQYLNESKDKFFSIIAHDLRAPFHGILGFSDVLETEIETLDEQSIRDIAGYLRSTAQATFKLLENLLQWAMSEGGAIVYQPQSVNIAELMSDVCEILQAIAQKKNIQIECDIEEGLYCYVDLNMMLSVLQNLISNALKFTPNGGQIYLSARKQQEQVEITVRDTGIGMSDEAFKNFNSRQQIRSEKGTEGEKGSGLGLLLCLQFIEKNQGDLTVKTEKGVGTTFVIHFSTQQSHRSQLINVDYKMIGEEYL
ncbi:MULTISPECIES: GAF domain-containing sensor histidine kinase [unclassified Acinetobacter]|uniref:GAF domain-containing sensor histidine kinase n=1 Tax=unclassified Acinetobacter TaxID=196816 RepID=UPI00190CF75E|nr:MULTISPECIES: GAF domain-containing sensor histidine kinase [unclassified Acinetobacter]MBK0064153.1 GAF domain-containing sensor histidine kinase [Acinetobacter sp. S55]MBK0067655.1 GAF domain-containing sensor histidine kinase [Acinetobacter sp. S54]